MLALSNVRTPDASKLDWREWLLHNAIEYRKAVCAHPNLIPVLMRRHALRIGLAEQNATAGLLAVQGVPPDAIMPLLEVIEEIALGSANYQSAADNDVQSESWKGDYPVLYHLSRTSSISRDRLFELVVRAMIDAVVEEVAAKQGA
jgi:hypothetical protein